MLLVNGVRYYPHRFAREDELEDLVEKHQSDIFGNSSVYFGKKKISSLSGIGGIPDAYAVLFSENPQWFVVEIELASYSLFDHIVPQITKFTNGLRNDATRRQLLKFMDKEIGSQPSVREAITKRFQEPYRFLSDVIYEEPTILIVIDQKIPQLDEVMGSIRGATEVVEFKTFEREGSRGEYAHFFEPIHGRTTRRESVATAPRRTRQGVAGKSTLQIPIGLHQILEVYQLSQTSTVSEAIREVAKRRSVTVQTVADKCTRKLGLSMSEFKKLMENRRDLASMLKRTFAEFSSEIDGSLSS